MREHEGHRSLQCDARLICTVKSCCRDGGVGWMSNEAGIRLRLIVEGDQLHDSRRGVRRLGANVFEGELCNPVLARYTMDIRCMTTTNPNLGRKRGTNPPTGNLRVRHQTGHVRIITERLVTIGVAATIELASTIAEVLLDYK
jgi:hypothetical protein